MAGGKKEYQYVELWSTKVSERSSIRISRMIDPPKERDYHINENYLKQAESPKDYEIESKERLKFKLNSEKYYLNAKIIGFDGNPFLSKGVSITREKIPSMITALQKIVDGEFDSEVKRILIQSGIIKDIKENVEEIQREEREEKNTEEEGFQEWHDGLSEPEKKEVKNMEKSGWTRPEIKLAFQFQRNK